MPALEPGEGVEPPSATNQIAALTLSYPGPRNVRPCAARPRGVSRTAVLAASCQI